MALDFGAAIVATVGYIALYRNTPSLFLHAGVISYIGVYRGPILRQHISETTFDLKALANDPDSRKFGLNAATLSRHRRLCLAVAAKDLKGKRSELRTRIAPMNVPRYDKAVFSEADLERGEQRTPLDSPKDIINEVHRLYDEFKLLGIDAKDLGDLRFFAYVGGERLKVLQLLAKIHCLVDDGIRVSQTVSIDQKLDALTVEELRSLATRERDTIETIENGELA